MNMSLIHASLHLMSLIVLAGATTSATSGKTGAEASSSASNVNSSEAEGGSTAAMAVAVGWVGAVLSVAMLLSPVVLIRRFALQSPPTAPIDLYRRQRQQQQQAVATSLPSAKPDQPPQPTAADSSRVAAPSLLWVSGVSVVPLLATTVACVAWITYGSALGKPEMYAGNVCGLFVAIVGVGAYYCTFTRELRSAQGWAAQASATRRRRHQKQKSGACGGAKNSNGGGGGGGSTTSSVTRRGGSGAAVPADDDPNVGAHNTSSDSGDDGADVRLPLVPSAATAPMIDGGSSTGSPCSISSTGSGWAPVTALEEEQLAVAIQRGVLERQMLLLQVVLTALVVVGQLFHRAGRGAAAVASLVPSSSPSTPSPPPLLRPQGHTEMAAFAATATIAMYTAPLLVIHEILLYHWRLRTRQTVNKNNLNANNTEMNNSAMAANDVDGGSPAAHPPSPSSSSVRRRARHVFTAANILSTLVNCGVWLVFGLLVEDPAVVACNACGIAVSGLQGLLFVLDW